MRDILKLFTNPEECAEEIIAGKGSRTVSKGIMIIIQAGLLVGFITVLGIKSSLPTLIEWLSQLNIQFLSGIDRLSTMNLGMLSASLALILSGLIIVGALISAVIMAFLLFIIKHLVRGQATFQELFRITIFSQVIGVCVMLADAICLSLINLTLAGGISEIIIGIIMIFQFWYLIFIIVGFGAANKVSFLKSIMAVFLMQGIFLAMQYFAITQIYFIIK